MKTNHLIPLFLCIACWAFMPECLNAQIVTKQTDDGSDGTLRREILDTPAGGMVTFATGIDTIIITQELVIDKALTIQGDPTSRVTIDGQGKSRIFTISADSVSLAYLTLTQSNFIDLMEEGAGIYAKDVHLKLIDVNITNCAASKGGGVYSSGSSDLEVMGGKFTGNGSSNGGAFYNNTGTMSLENVLVDGNSRAIFNNDGNLSISGSTISNNEAFVGDDNYPVAAIYNSGGYVSIVGSTVSGNGSDSYGGAVYSEAGELEITDSDIINNGTKRGGAGLCLFSNDLVTLNNVNLSGNGSGFAYPNNGGAIYAIDGGDIVINGGAITNNEATSDGGGIYIEGATVTINGTKIAGNRSETFAPGLGGAGIYCGSGTLILNAGTQVTGNIPGEDFGLGDGGGIFMNAGSLIINGTVENPVIFEGNMANAGGAIASTSPQPAELNNVKFISNMASHGGAVHFSGPGIMTITAGSASNNGTGEIPSVEGGSFWNGMGTINIDGTNFNGNSAAAGGALFNNGGTLNIKNAQLVNNGSDVPGSRGGGIYNTSGGSLTVNRTAIVHNFAVSAGGGISDNSTGGQGTLTLTDVVLAKNSAHGTSGSGGALAMTGNGSAIITSCTFSGNSANDRAGAIWNDAGNIHIKTSTISMNNTTGLDFDDANDANGGAIYNSAGSIHINASTLALNQSQGAGGGIFNGSPAATTTLKNSIVAQNTAVKGNDLAGENDFISADYNLVGQDDLDVFQMMVNDLKGTAASPIDPFIDALADNGGFTMTHALREKSPAYNAGNPVDVFPDQRGEVVFGGRRDIGAFEAQADLGIKDSPAIALSESLLYPNPSNGGTVVLCIPATVTSTIAISVIEIGTGKVILRQVGKAGGNELMTGSLATGAYLVRMVTGKSVESLKMIVGR